MSRAAVGMTLLVLSGCKIFVKDEPPPCPRVSVLEDASKLVRFTGASHDPSTIQMSAEITKYRGSCYYDKDDKKMEVTLNVGIDAFAGPAFTGGGKQQLQYFVAIPAFTGADGKQIFPLAIDVPKDAKGTHITDGDVTLSFPVKDIKKLEAYEIFVGFQLTKDELDYNRKHDFR